MQGLLRRLFAPRWQHPSPDVRRRALEQLDPGRPDDRRGLEALTRDSHADIRLAALCALDDLPGLAQAFAEQSDDAWRAALAARLCGREGQSPLAERQRQVEQLDDTRLLRDVAFHGDNLDLRLAALARLNDERDLIDQACHNRVATVRHRAAQRVSSEAGLKRLLKESRRDRQVAQRAREHLNRLKADAQWVRDQQQRRDVLLEQLESLARSVWEPHYQTRLRHLQKEWETLAHPPGSDAEARYQHAVTRAEKTLHDRAAEEHARKQHQRRQQSADDERETLLAAFESSLDELSQGQAPGAQNFASLRAQRRLAGQQWQALSDIHPPAEPARQRYAQAMKRYERYSAAWQRYLDATPELEHALKNDDPQALSAQAKACQWPEELPLPPLLAQARRQAQQRKDASRADAEPHSLDQALGTLEQHLERGEFNEANRLHQQLKPHIQALRGPDSESLQARLRQLGARLAELRDWRGFVAGPKREQLCTSIETLAYNVELTDTALDRRHRQLVKEWKALGDAAATREMSRRFRAASDRIHQRLKPWRERLDQQRSANLAAREALCEQLEMLLKQPADNADPDALRQIRDRSRYQWREYSPVPRQDAEAVGRRFGRARHRLQALIDRRAREIAAHKRALVEQVQALEHGTEPLDTRIARAKALQQEWRQLGRAPKGEEKPLWRTFRRSCDRLFAARNAHRNERAERQQQRLDAMQALLDRMDAWQPQDTTDAPALEAFIREAEALEPLPRGRRSDGMQKRLTGIIRARRERLDQLETDAVITRWQQSVPLLNAHLAADQAALNGDAVREVDAAPVLGAPLFERFAEAHRQRNASRHRAKHFDARAHEVQRDSLARLRVHLSLLATGQVRQSDEPLRLAIQVERLNEGLGLGHERSTADELGSLLADLLALGPMPQGLWEANVNDFDALIHQLSGGQGNEVSDEHKDV
ncbi:DUF349 domain-containing protein [Halomonas piscis]|uniref:DUF349 domain-containing protein n=1 Tax=Halomonas piscis TaxID=3031727 RepID=A0ABY9YY74_9GAMM|nr:DUF349 domain-containing protein [Halomonas piscis]WNK19736.1 DUF349 domain-containing protein [Halomonas piscis]